MGIFEFDDRLVHFAQRENAHSGIWQYECELLYPFSTGKPSQAITHVEHDFSFRDDLRVISGGEVVVHAADGTADTISITPVTNFWPGFAGYDGEGVGFSPPAGRQPVPGLRSAAPGAGDEAVTEYAHHRAHRVLA